MTDVGCTARSPVGEMLLVGGAHVDRIARSSVSFRPGASNPGVLRESIGGASLNAAVALRSFGARVRLVSARGGDAGAAAVIDELARHGIEDEAIVWLDRETASYTAILDDTGELVAGVADMAIYDMVTPRALSRRHLREGLASAPALLVDANLSAPTLKALCERTQGLRAAIAVSPEKVVRLREVAPHLDLVFLSLAEARALTGCHGPFGEIRAALSTLGVRRGVVTDGPRAVLVIDGTAAFHQQPASITNVRDVTGAGDTLAAVTFLAYAGGHPLASAVRLGLAASALRITEGLGPETASRAARIAEALPPALPFIEDPVA